MASGHAHTSPSRNYGAMAHDPIAFSDLYRQFGSSSAAERAERVAAALREISPPRSSRMDPNVTAGSEFRLDGVHGGVTRGDPTSSKAVISALRSLQEKIKFLEEERDSLQRSLSERDSIRDQDASQHRQLQRQLQLQLQESVKTMTARSNAELDDLRFQLLRKEQEMSDSVASLQRQIQEINGEKAILISRLDATTMLANQRAQEIDTLRNGTSQLQGERAAAAASVEAISDRLRLADDELAASQRECKAQQHRADMASERTHVLEQRIIELEGKLDNALGAQARSERAESEVIRLERHMEELRHQLTEMASDKAVAEADKAKIEETLRNVLFINDQLLDKMLDEPEDMSRSDASPLRHRSPTRIRRKPAAAPKRPSTARTTRVCRRQAAQQKQVDHDVSSLRGTLLDEIQILRKQYREIVTQVTGSGSSGFDSGALNVALRNVIDKLERKGEQLQLIDRMERDVSRPTTSHHAWLP